MPDEHTIAIEGGSRARQNGAHPRPRLVVGIFHDAADARSVAERLRRGSGGSVSLLSNGASALQSSDVLPALGSGRLYQQVTAQLQSGAAVVVVVAQTLEQQLGISRALLESKCDMLLTHDGSGQDHAD